MLFGFVGKLWLQRMKIKEESIDKTYSNANYSYIAIDDTI